MTNAKEDVRSDIAIMRRAAEKAETEVSKAEIEKQRQVRFIYTLLLRTIKFTDEKFVLLGLAVIWSLSKVPNFWLKFSHTLFKKNKTASDVNIHVSCNSLQILRI